MLRCHQRKGTIAVNNPEQSRVDALQDMDPEAFRHYGHAVVDWVAEYLANVGDYPVLAQVQPGDIRSQLPPEPPEAPASMQTILADFEQQIVPGITHWN